MGRPRKQVDEEKLFTLASLGLTTAEIASVLECSPDTLERNYKEEMAEGKEKCKASVRRKQFELAMAGNPTMLIWLGKQILGQSDKAEFKRTDDPLAMLLSEFRSQYEAIPKAEAPHADS